jgi:hypothetical protein
MPFPAHEVHRRKLRVELVADLGDVLGVGIVVHGIRFHLAHDAAVQDVGGLGQADLLELRFGQVDERGVRGAPEPVTLEAEVLEAVAAERGIRNHLGDQDLKFWTRPTFTLGSWI